MIQNHQMSTWRNHLNHFLGLDILKLSMTSASQFQLTLFG